MIVNGRSSFEFELCVCVNDLLVSDVMTMLPGANVLLHWN